MSGNFYIFPFLRPQIEIFAWGILRNEKKNSLKNNLIFQSFTFLIMVGLAGSTNVSKHYTDHITDINSTRSKQLMKIALRAPAGYL